MQNNESFTLKNYSNATTQTPFVVAGGYYALIYKTGSPSSSNHVDVVRKAGDGSTDVVMIAGSQSATSGVAYAYLPPGTYSYLVTGTLSGIYTELVRIPIN